MKKAELEELRSSLAELEPQDSEPCSLASLVCAFAEISAWHRPSGQERGLLEWLVSEAGRLGCRSSFDQAGNLLIRVPACNSREQRPVLIQAHVDMVCVAGPDYDWAGDGVQLVRDGEWLQARGTSLGADNGAGVAMMLVLMREWQRLAHPPLELLFTVGEEVGLIGAQQLESSNLRSFAMINLDSEDSSYLVHACAGGETYRLSAPLERDRLGVDQAWELGIAGLPGGHSGVSIGEYRGNALLLLYRCWLALQQHFDGGLRLLGLEGGQASNVIPSHGTLRFGLRRHDPLLAAESAAGLSVKFGQCLAAMLERERQIFPQLSWSLQLVNEERAPLTRAGEKLVKILPLLPDGVFLYHRQRNLVELSANLAACSLTAEQFNLTASLRYMCPSQLPWLKDRVEQAADLCGFSCEREGSYPSWSAAGDSGLCQLALACYQQLFDQPAQLLALHGGLECGVVVDKIHQTQGRKIDAISMGPTIEAVHSTGERLLLPSFRQSARLLARLLARLAEPENTH